MGNFYFAYSPDFWNTRLQEAIPVAELLYGYVVDENKFPQELAIDPVAFDVFLKNKSTQDRKLFFGRFLSHLRTWQMRAGLEFRRMMWLPAWPGRLGEAERAYTESQKDTK